MTWRIIATGILGLTTRHLHPALRQEITELLREITEGLR